MPRIANADEIKRAANIADIIGRRIVLHPGRGHLEGSCPFHASRSGRSFHVTPDKNSWYCWGCHNGGNAVSFVMEFEKCDYHQALEIVASESNIPVVYETNGQAAVSTRNPDAPTRQELMHALEAACAHYCAMLELPESKPALDYMLERGFTLDTLHKYRIGYALEHRTANLPNQGALLAAGILKRNEYGIRDPLSGRVTIPICDQMGRPLAFTGRLIENRPDAPKYLNTIETEVFRKDRTLFGYHQARRLLASANTSRLLHVIEGQLKCIALLENGLPAVAAGGTGFSEVQAAMLARLSQNIVIVPDPDQAGEKAAIRTAGILRASELSVSIGLLDRSADPHAKDPDDLWAKGIPVKINAAPFVSWLYHRVAPGKVATIEEAARITKKIVPIIQSNPLPAVGAIELRQLSTLSGLPESALTAAKTTAVARPQPQTEVPAQAVDTSLPPERMLVASILQAGPADNPEWPSTLPLLELPPFVLTCLSDILWTFRYCARHGVSVSDALPMSVPPQRLPWYRYWLSADIGTPTVLDCQELCETIAINHRNNLAMQSAACGLLELSTLIQNWR